MQHKGKPTSPSGSVAHYRASDLKWQPLEAEIEQGQTYPTGSLAAHQTRPLSSARTILSLGQHVAIQRDSATLRARSRPAYLAPTRFHGSSRQCAAPPTSLAQLGSRMHPRKSRVPETSGLVPRSQAAIVQRQRHTPCCSALSLSLPFTGVHNEAAAGTLHEQLARGCLPHLVRR